MGKVSYKDYLNLGICPNLDDEGIHFSQENVDFIIEKYLKQSKKFEEYKQSSEVRDRIADSQFDMAKARAEYLENERQHLKEQLKEIRFHNKQHDRIMEINAGLRRECQRYKEREKQFQAQIYALQQQLIEKDDEIGALKVVIENWKRTNKRLSREKTKAVCDYDNLIRNVKKFADKQLAIHELEKVKELNSQLVFSNKIIENFIDQQIKKMKGNKNDS